MEILLNNKVALITGATSGIGEATARLFAQCGATLFLTGRNAQKLSELQSELGEITSVNTLAGDVGDAAFREQLVQSCVQHFGKLDILVNSAGIIDTGTVENTPLSAYEALMNVNLTAVFHLMQLAIPELKKTRGNIVNVSSVAGPRAYPGIAAYCISKAGVDQLTRVAALELAPSGVRVNSVNPGVVVTKLHTRRVMDDEQYRQFLEHSKETHPLGRAGKPEEIADLIAFLASDHAAWITGANYAIDGGRGVASPR